MADIRRAIFDQVVGMSPAFYERIMTGEVLSRLTTDTTLVLSVIGSSVSIALRNMLTLVGGLLLLAVTSPKLTALVLVVVPLVVAPILTLGRRLRELSRENQDRIADSERARLRGAARRADGAGQHPRGGQPRGLRDADRARLRRGAAPRSGRAVMTAIVIFLVFASVVGVLWVGARDVRAGGDDRRRAGAVRPLRGDGGRRGRLALRDLGRGAARRRRHRAPDRDPRRPPHGHRPPAPAARCRAVLRGEIGFEEVTFRYPARPDRPRARRLSLHVRPGETVALVGPSGAGKSTMFQLLLRFFDPEAGAVTLDGVDLRDVTRARLRRQHRAGAAGAGDLRRHARATTSASAGPRRATPR